MFFMRDTVQKSKVIENFNVKKGILLVAFGSGESTANVALTNIYEKVCEIFPNTEIRWAYTSAFIRKKLKSQGENINSPLVAISKMIDDGFTHIAVQSMHTIPGAEYDYLVQVVEQIQKIPKGTEKIIIGRPLLYAHQDIERAVNAMINSFPERNNDEATIWMGHGSPHFSNVFYPAINYYLNHKCDHVFMGTIESYPSIYDIIDQFKEHDYRKVRLIPFVSVVGNHVKQDMCGDDKKSWYNILRAEGFEVECVLKGTGEMDELVKIWVDHLSEVWQQLL